MSDCEGCAKRDIEILKLQTKLDDVEEERNMSNEICDEYAEAQTMIELELGIDLLACPVDTSDKEKASWKVLAKEAVRRIRVLKNEWERLTEMVQFDGGHSPPSLSMCSPCHLMSCSSYPMDFGFSHSVSARAAFKSRNLSRSFPDGCFPRR